MYIKYAKICILRLINYTKYVKISIERGGVNEP